MLPLPYDLKETFAASISKAGVITAEYPLPPLKSVSLMCPYF
jgi:hypothetical protein